jgi:hypothetical protein
MGNYRSEQLPSGESRFDTLAPRLGVFRHRIDPVVRPSGEHDRPATPAVRSDV